MPTRIFITGGTGYITGTVLDTLVNQRPQYEVTVLLRTVPAGFKERYPTVRVVEGNFDDFDLIAETASKSNISIHGGNSKHQGAIKAHIAGLLRRDSTSFFIRLGGTGIIADFLTGPYGELNPKVWSDIDDLDTLTSLPDTTPHRPVEKIIQAAAEEHGDRLKCAIICASGIYGKGRGMVRQQSLWMPDFYSEVVKFGATFYTGTGGNSRGWTHIDDLMEIYLALVDDAAQGGGAADWGKAGYYFTCSHEATQLELAVEGGKILKKHGLLESEVPQQVSIEQIKAMDCGSSWPWEGIYTFACNTRARADRAKKVLGYQPKAPTVFETMEEDLLACRKY